MKFINVQPVLPDCVPGPRRAQAFPVYPHADLSAKPVPAWFQSEDYQAENGTFGLDITHRLSTDFHPDPLGPSSTKATVQNQAVDNCAHQMGSIVPGLKTRGGKLDVTRGATDDRQGYTQGEQNKKTYYI